MYKWLKKVRQVIYTYFYLYTGIHLFSGTFSLRKYLKLRRDLIKFKEQSLYSDFIFPVSKLFPCYEDIEDNAGSIPTHYFFQDLYVAQRIFFNRPFRHVDIGSRVDGFVAHVATFREIEVFDIRPLDIPVTNVKFTQIDITQDPGSFLESIDSISCLHALEHFGLGRYGDPICFDGFYTGFLNITKLLKRGGTFYFSVPIGPQRVEFHGQRIFSLDFLVKIITPYYNVKILSIIDDQNVLHSDVKFSPIDLGENFNCNFGCAIFELIKK